MLLNFHHHLPQSASQTWIFLVNSDSLTSLEKFTMPSFSVCVTGRLILSTKAYEMMMCCSPVSEAHQ